MMVTIAQKSYFCVNIDILSKKLGISNVFNFPPLDSPQFSLCASTFVCSLAEAGGGSIGPRPGVCHKMAAVRPPVGSVLV